MSMRYARVAMQAEDLALRMTGMMPDGSGGALLTAHELRCQRAISCRRRKRPAVGQNSR